MPETFADNDLGYTTWLREHPKGFVLNCERNPRAAYLMVHRASCHTITGTPARGTTWTEGGYIKICSDEIGDLESWARGATGGTIQRCGSCVP